MTFHLKIMGISVYISIIELKLNLGNAKCKILHKFDFNFWCLFTRELQFLSSLWAFDKQGYLWMVCMHLLLFLSISISQITIICLFLAKLFCVLYSTFKHWALRWEDGIMLHLTTQLWIIQIKLGTKETFILFYFYFIQSCYSPALHCLFLTGLQRTFNIYLSVLKRIDKYLVDCDNSTMHSGRGRGWYYTHTKHKAYFMLQLLNRNRMSIFLRSKDLFLFLYFITI